MDWCQVSWAVTASEQAPLPCVWQAPATCVATGNIPVQLYSTVDSIYAALWNCESAPNGGCDRRLFRSSSFAVTAGQHTITMITSVWDYQLAGTRALFLETSAFDSRFEPIRFPICLTQVCTSIQDTQYCWMESNIIQIYFHELEYSIRNTACEHIRWLDELTKAVAVYTAESADFLGTCCAPLVQIWTTSFGPVLTNQTLVLKKIRTLHPIWKYLNNHNVIMSCYVSVYNVCVRHPVLMWDWCWMLLCYIERL